MNVNPNMGGYYGQQPPPPPQIYANQPIVMFPAMTYEQQIIYRQQLAAQQREYINKFLKENLPVKYVLFHACVLGLIGVTCIVLQIVLLVNGAYNAYIANGIWGGLVCIGLSVLALRLCEYISVLMLNFSSV